MFNNININKELYGVAIIKRNGKTFNLIVATNNYIKTFTFRKNYFLVQVKIIKNDKIKSIKRLIAYAKLATKFFDNRL